VKVIDADILLYTHLAVYSPDGEVQLPSQKLPVVGGVVVLGTSAGVIKVHVSLKSVLGRNETG
jgi:hypothetical protein